MTETRIIPMLKNYMGDNVSADFYEAEWFRVEVAGVWVGDYTRYSDANAAFARALIERDDKLAATERRT
jgi:hypothetical protein